MKNKKIISLICALAMIFTMLSSFSVLADGEKGIKLDASISSDNKTITIEATAVNTVGNLSNFMLAIAVPEGVTTADVTATSSASLSDPNVADGILYVPFLSTSAAGTAFADGKLATVTINLTTALADDFEIKLTDEAGIEDTEGATYVEDGMDNSAVTVVPSGKKPAKADRPAEDTSSSEETVAPTPVAPVEGTKGIALTSSIDNTGKVVTIEATAVNTVGNLSNFMLAITVPEGVTTADVTATSSASLSDPNVADGILYVPFLSTSAAGTAFADGKLATITINLPEALTAPYAFTLTDEAGIEDTVGAIYVEDGMTATSTVVTPATEEPTTVKTLPLKDYVGKDGDTTAAEAAKTAQDAGKTVYLTVDVKKADGTTATYGVDYAAEYPAGTVLTEKEYNNLIHGYTNADMADVINNLKFRVYSDNVATISTTLNTVEDDKQLVDPVDDQKITAPAATQAPKAPVLSVSPSSKSVTAGTKVTITASVSNPADDGVISWAVTTGNDNVAGYAVADDTKSVSFKPASKGTIVVTATYTYTDDNGEEQVQTKTSKITVTEKSSSTSSSSSSSSSSSGNGGIAYGSTTTGTSSAKIAFTDIDTVPWAEDAILALVDKGVINGRSESIFDPNGTVTRAEFAKMVVLAFNLTGGNGVDQFSDVETTDWYAQYVARGYYNGVISGYDDGTFRPNGLISRQEMAAMISRAINAANKTLPATVAAESFSDADQIGDWAIDAVTTLQQGGVINGMGDGTYAPADNATRAQAAVIINRAITNAQ
jgi:hypothetical protein